MLKRLVLSMLTVLALVSGAVAQDMTKQTVTGTVVSTTGDVLVIDTPTGRMTFKLDSTLDRIRYNDVKVGQRIEVVHRLDSNGADQVVTEVTTLTPTTTTTTTTTTTSPNTYADNTQTTTDNTTYNSDQLPATASPLAIAALIGLAAVLGGLGLKKAKKSQPKPVRS